MKPSRQRIDVYIKQLLLDGVGLRPGEQDLVRQALETELVERLTTGEQPTERVRDGFPATVAWQPGGDGAALGQQIGEVVHRSVRP